MPSRAQGFHRLRRRLLEDIGRQLGRRFGWIDEASVAECRDRYQRLGALAPNLTDLVRKTQALESELDVLEQKFAEFPELGKLRCEQWRRDLIRLPAACEQEVDLSVARREVDRIETRLREHGEALSWVERAERLLRALGSSADTALLAAELPELRDALAAGEGLDRVIARLRSLCPPLEARTRAVPPPELLRLGPLLADLRGWDKKLNGEEGGGDPRVVELSRRHQRLQDEWRRLEAAEFQALSREAGELREELAGRAWQFREGRLRELEELLADLEHACGPQPKIRASLDRLKARPVDRYQEHEDWLAEFAEANEYFKAIAGDHSPALEQRLRERRETLGRSLHALLDGPLADEPRQRGEILEAELDALSGLEETGDLLRALRRSNELQRRLEELEREARSFLEELSQVQLRLNERNGWLQAEGGRLGFAGTDFSAPIAALKEGATHRTLEQARRLAGELETALAGEERGFLEHGRRLLAERAAASAGLLEALQAAGLAGSTVAAGIPGPIAEPREVPRRLAEAESEHRRLAARVEEALRAAEQERVRMAERLSALDPGTCNPPDRDEAAALALRLAAAPGADAAERLRVLAEGLAAAGAFLRRLSIEQEGLAHRLARLKTRLAVFNREGLKAFCPEALFHRVSDLTYGIPEPPRAGHLPQLKQAEALLDRIETQSRRVVAETVADRLATLRRCVHQHPEPGLVSALLERVEGLDREQPVPLQLREQIQEAVALSGGGRSDGRP